MKTPLVLLIAVFIGFNFQASGAETIPPKQGQGLNQANTMGAGVAPIPQFRGDTIPGDRLSIRRKTSLKP